VAILSSSWGSSRLLCIEGAALRQFRIAILIRIGVERKERRTSR
jgi:hypothetical protein